jgi:hypothetical protein
MYKKFIIVKSGSLISYQTYQIKNTPHGELFLLSKGCRSSLACCTAILTIDVMIDHLLSNWNNQISFCIHLLIRKEIG